MRVAAGQIRAAPRTGGRFSAVPLVRPCIHHEGRDKLLFDAKLYVLDQVLWPVPRYNLEGPPVHVKPDPWARHGSLKQKGYQPGVSRRPEA